MKNQKIIIQKQILHFQYNGKADGFALQQEVNSWCNTSLIPEIEQQFALFDLGDNYLSIDKLEIDATVDKKDWQQQIKDELIINLQQQLGKYKDRLLKDDKSAEFISNKRDELILYYFEKGYLPWWYKALTEGDLKSELDEWIREDKDTARANEIRQRLQKMLSKTVIERMVNQLPDLLLFQFLKNVFKKEKAWIDQSGLFFSELINSNLVGKKQKHLLQPVYHFILATLIKNEGEIRPDDMFRILYNELQKEKGLTRLQKSATDMEIGKTNPVKKAWQEFLEKEKRTEINFDQFRNNKLINELTTSDKMDIEKTINQESEEIYIYNAGAVIITAFLPVLFNKLKLIRDGLLVNPDVALLLIQYAVTGKERMEEYELLLPKILCGLHIELPVDTNINLTDDQKKEVEDMLLSVIEYWVAIKNTSIISLQDSFLMRNGKLTRKNNDWLLQVEQRSYDVLLQQLPWSISLIRLPWMPGFLKVEWV